MTLVVGLGNPGLKYRFNRHNVGYMILSHLAGEHGIRLDVRRHLCRYGSGTIQGKRVLLARPRLYMNLVGRAVGRLLEKTGSGPGDLIILHDDLDLPAGQVRIKQGGGHGGHNGLRSVIDWLQTGDFRRVKVGIGRPPGRMPPEAWVLQNFSEEEKPLITRGIEEAAEAVKELIENSI